MAGIGGLSGSSSSNASSIRGYGGLASGLDRDSLIESMTYATTSKIQKQMQAKQKISWQQEAMRGITDKLHGFAQAFTSYTSPKNLLSSKLFSSSTITAQGSNSDCISVTGNSSMADSMSITGIRQMATNAKINFKDTASDMKLDSGGISLDMNDTNTYNTIAGSSMTVKYGTKYYLVSLPEDDPDYKYDSAADVAASLTKAMGEVTVGDGVTLKDALSVTAVGDRLTFRNTDKSGNSISLAGSTEKLLTNLGFGEPSGGKEIDISATGLKASSDVKYEEVKSVADQIGGKQVCFTYNGKTEWIELTGAKELKDAGAGGFELLKKNLQTELDKRFGKGRIEIDESAITNPDGSHTLNKLEFKTVNPDKTEDKSSVLSIAAADRGLLGRYGALTGLSAGDSNRLNLNGSFMQSGLKTIPEGTTFPENGELLINGAKIEVTKDSTLREIMDAINANEEANVKISYLADADRFVLTSTADGASGGVKLDGTISELLFGKASATQGDGGYEVINGQDAVLAVKYDGAAEETLITRGTNSFSLNGLNVTLKKEFGFTNITDTTTTPGTEAITFDVNMNTEPAAEAVKEMVEAYNEMIKLINDEVSTKPNRDYSPLTTEQESDMSESQIEAWNKKAKAGQFFNDNDIRELANGLRSLMTGDSQRMSKMGISVSTDYGENGKLAFDEEAFKSALASDPSGVIDAFTRERKVAANGDVEDAGGMMVRMQTLTDKYASMTGSIKGILVQRAGSVFAPTSVLTNSMQKQMDGIDDEIDRLKDKLKIEQDRYISQFTVLETLISQMNSQSSWLSSAMG